MFCFFFEKKVTPYNFNVELRFYFLFFELILRFVYDVNIRKLS